MNKKKIVSCLMTATMVVASLAGCGSDADGESGSSGGSKTLNVLTWEGDVAEEAVKAFEEEYDVTVNITYVEDTNTILAKMLQGNSEYDVIDLESAYVQSFIDADLLAPLDYDVMDNIDNINEEYLAKGPIGDEDLEYTIPLCGPLYTGVVVNTETCPIEITSFADLADPALEGEVWCTNATISLYAGALQSLGYSPNSSDEDELNEAQALLQEIKPNIKAFGSSCVSAMETGDCSVAYCWDYNILMCDDKENWDKFEIIPETVLGYTQYWSIAKDSENQELANEFINFTFSIESAVEIAEEWGGVPVVKQELIEDYLEEDYFDNPIMQEFADMWADHTDLAVSDEQTAIMDTLYNELMSGE